MGEFNLLRELTKGNDAIATKVIKFKQSQLIFSLHGAIDNSHFLICKGGMCTSITLQWIKEQLQGGLVFFVRRGPKSSDAGARATHEGGLFQLAPDWVEIHPTSKTGYEQQDALAKTFGLKLGSVRPEDPTKKRHPMLKVLLEESNSLKDKCATVINYVNTNGQSHDVGLFQDAESKTHFFDPNFGEYIIADGKLRDFFATYQEAIKEKPLELTAQFAYARTASL
jgi:hypothetical protein